MTELSVHDALFTTRAMRHLRPDPVAREDLEYLIEAATMAPSAGNLQMWAFVVVTEAEQRRRIAALHREAGLQYIHIPFRAPNAEVIEAFLSAISNTDNQPAYIHCASANRVGAMWFIKRVKQDGWDSDRAMAEAEIKLLGDGDAPKNLSVKVHAASAGARKKIEAAGGSVELS